MRIYEILQALQPSILEGSASVNPDNTVLHTEFYRYAKNHHSANLYILDAKEADSLSFPASDRQLTLLVACEDGIRPAFCPPENYAVLYLKKPLNELLQECLEVLHREETRRRIRSLFEMGQKARLHITDLLSAACRALEIGVCLFYDRDNKLLLEECADSLCSAYALNGENKSGFFRIMGPNVQEALRSRSSRFVKDGFCYEVRHATLNYKMDMTLVVFYDELVAFDFNLFAQLTCDHANRQSLLKNGEADELNVLSRILDGSMRDYPAIADILFGADQEQKGFRVVQIRPSDENVLWRQWSASIRTLLRSAFVRVHILEDGSTMTAVPIAKFRSVYKFEETKNSRTPIRYFNDGWDREKLIGQLLLSGADCMVSPVTSSMDALAPLHEHTRLTLDIARKVERDDAESHVWYHTDFMPYLPIHYGLQLYRSRNTGKRAVGLWMHPEAFRLIRSDAAEHKDLTRVLYTYLLSGMDVAEVSRKLFMHRNTVYSRLKAIETFTGTSLKDGVFFSSFLPSLRLYYYCRYYLNIDENQILFSRDGFTDQAAFPQPGSTE